MSSPPRLTAQDWALIALLSVLWGGSFVLVEVALTGAGPLGIVTGRVGLAALALLAWVRIAGLPVPPLAPWLAPFLVMGLLNNVAPFVLIAWAQVHIEAGLASILNATTPLFSVVLAHFLIGDERLRANRVAGVIAGIAGVAVLVGPQALAGLGAAGVAQLAVLTAACSYAVAGIWGRRLRTLPAPVAAAGMLAASTLVLVPLWLVFEPPGGALPAPAALGAVLGLALLSTALAYLIYFRVLARAGATNVLLVTLLIPVSALLLGALLLGEQVGARELAGMALIGAGLGLVDGRVLHFGRRRAEV